MELTQSQLLSLTPATRFSRRGMIAGGLSAGFALAVQPVAATTITTDTKGLDAIDVRIPVADGTLPGFRAMPETGGPFPTIVVVNEVFGVHAHVQDVCVRLAKLGYFAVAPELFAREGDVNTMTDLKTILDTVTAKTPNSQVATDLDSTIAWAATTKKTDIERLGITGFCWGGREVWLYAARNPALKAGVAWYGGPLVGWTPADAGNPAIRQWDREYRPKDPIEVVGDLKAPILGLYGGADPGIPVASVERMREALKAAGKTAEIIVYPDTPHGFHADYRPAYREGPAKDGWRRMLDWFTRYGVA